MNGGAFFGAGAREYAPFLGGFSCLGALFRVWQTDVACSKFSAKLSRSLNPCRMFINGEAVLYLLTTGEASDWESELLLKQSRLWGFG